jgi:cytochrome c2
MPNQRIFAIILLIMLTLAACSGDDSSQNDNSSSSTQNPTLTTTSPQSPTQDEAGNNDGDNPDTTSGDAERGATLFLEGKEDAPACRSCHLNTPTGFGASQMTGPNLVGVGERAGTRIAGLDAAAYIRQSILHPNEFLVEGYPPAMFPNYADYLTEQDINDLIAYLLGL